MKIRAAFYDLDGTLIAGNVVTRYVYYVRNHPSRLRAVLEYAKLLLSAPFLIGLDLYSRRLFNEVFYRQYRGLPKEWLESQAESLFEKVIRPSIYPGARDLVDADRAKGYRPVLVTGALDFDLGPVLRYFGFQDVICNSLVYDDGRATGRIAAPLIAEAEKQAALIRLCHRYDIDIALSKAYSDSLSDLPMLESVGLPHAVNPDSRLRRVAAARGWPILDLKRTASGAAVARSR
ncbi:MAG TPA: HAD-IB family hydrolase [Bryobacterales bacterium]|jgi:HAD superfamily hydrolase (TIGR01490 family)|nr:HAD-IB family hydrolase [Bryobacterales bacterium]